ncbi:MAG TPA: SRPBCC family protein [Rhizobacter sp.]|nr:SRPBCC family protein [Rhizobacter sp.]
MASIHQEIVIDVPASQLWSALRDVGALHTRIAVGFVADCRMDGGEARIVTFANGLVVRELILDVDDARRRVAWSAVGGRLSHHNASMQVFDDGAQRCRAVWIADLLPHAMAPAVASMIEQGLAAMKKTLEAAVTTGSAAHESR